MPKLTISLLIRLVLIVLSLSLLAKVVTLQAVSNVLLLSTFSRMAVVQTVLSHVDYVPTRLTALNVSLTTISVETSVSLASVLV